MIDSSTVERNNISLKYADDEGGREEGEEEFRRLLHTEQKKRRDSSKHEIIPSIPTPPSHLHLRSKRVILPQISIVIIVVIPHMIIRSGGEEGYSP